MNTPETPFVSPTAVDDSSESARSWIIALHLSGLSGLFFSLVLGHLLVPLLIWLFKRADHPSIDRAGKEVLNFQLSYTLYLVVSGLSFFFIIGFVFLPLILPLILFGTIAWFVLPIIAAIKTSNGIAYRYPFTIRFLS